MYQAIKKYGIENLDFEVICKGTEEYVKEMEVRAICMLNTMAHSGYNLTEGGEGSSGWKASDVTRQRMRDSHMGTTGKKHSDATKQKIRETRLKYTRGKHPRATEIVVDAKCYSCLRDAAEDIGIPYSTFCAKQRSTKSTTFMYQPNGVLTPVTAH